MAFMGCYFSPLAVVLLASGVLISSRISRKARQDPACASCGYPVRNLPEPTCPECGKNLLDDGIVGRGRLTRHLVLARAAITLGLALFLGLLAQAMLLGAGPHRHIEVRAVALRVSPGASNYGFVVQASASGRSMGAGRIDIPVKSVRVEYQVNNIGRTEMEFRVGKDGVKQLKAADNFAVGPEEVIREKTERWLRAETDVDEEHAQDHAAFLAAIIAGGCESQLVRSMDRARFDAYTAGDLAPPFLQVAGTSSSRGATPVIWITYLPYLPLLGLWAAWSTNQFRRWRQLRTLDRSGATWDELRR